VNAHVRAALAKIAEGLSELVQADAGDAPYTQDFPPPDVRSRDAFLRLHRVRVKAQTPGWSCVGKVRAVTREAWSAHVDGETAAVARPKLALVSAEPQVGEIEKALGIVLQRRGGR
jgi:hypothetical protein